MCFLGIEIQVEHMEGMAIVAVSGCVVGDAFYQLRRNIERAITSTKSLRFVLDLPQDVVVDRKCLDGLLSFFYKARARGGKMALVFRGLELVDTGVEIVNIISLITFHYYFAPLFYKSREEAIQALTSQ